MKRNNWRDCKAWVDAGLPLSTSSNEACKLYDACVSQSTGFYDEPSVGGLEKCTKAMLTADPDFVMGHIFTNYLGLGGTEKPLHLNSEMQQKIQHVNTLASTATLNERELKHLKALDLFARGKRYAAIQVWEDILVDHPTDLLASRQAFIGMINNGKVAENKDITARTLTGYTKDTPGYSTILGWHAFNLEETNHYDLAEQTAKQCLELDPYETYGAHALAHTYLERGQHQKGIDFMLSTENNWKSSNHFACHNYWHISLFYAERGQYEEALTIFDQQIGPRTSANKSDFNLTDGAALLYRLQMDGVDVGNRWDALQETCDVYIYGHGSMFVEGTILFTSCHSENKEKRYKQLESLKQYGKGDPEDWDNKKVTAEVGVPLCEGIVAFEEKKYSTAVELLYPIRYEIPRVGGSHAQRDVFHQLLIQAAIKSDKQAHNKIGRMLLAERSVTKESDPWSERLRSEFIAAHGS